MQADFKKYILVLCKVLDKYTFGLCAHAKYVGEQYARRIGPRVNSLEHVKNMLEKVHETLSIANSFFNLHNLQICDVTRTIQMCILVQHQ